MSLPEVGVKNFNVIQDRNQWKKKNGWTEHNRITLQLVPFYRSCYRLLCDRPSKREEDKCTKKTHRDIQEQRKHKEVYQRDKNKIGRKHKKEWTLVSFTDAWMFRVLQQHSLDSVLLTRLWSTSSSIMFLTKTMTSKREKRANTRIQNINGLLI